jgi:hypothetical protein
MEPERVNLGGLLVINMHFFFFFDYHSFHFLFLSNNMVSKEDLHEDTLEPLKQEFYEGKHLAEPVKEIKVIQKE